MLDEAVDSKAGMKHVIGMSRNSLTPKQKQRMGVEQNIYHSFA